MTHDPLCPYEPKQSFHCCTPQTILCLAAHTTPGISCQCDLIAKVRSDEQQQVASRLTAYHAEGCIGGVSNLGCGCGLWNDVVTYSVELP